MSIARGISSRLLKRLRNHQRGCRCYSGSPRRKGAVAYLAAVLLAVLFAFVSFAVDTGVLALTQINLQNAVDAAALAASQEIRGAILQAGEDDGMTIGDANNLAVTNARLIAEQVALANGVFIDPDVDVEFGNRSYDEASDSWPITWNLPPYNVVRVTARRDQENMAQPDGKIKLNFGWAVGMPTAALKASASAFIEARDIALVLDYSGSMNYDSQFREDTIDKLGQTAVEENLQDIWGDLGSPTYGNLEFEPKYATVSLSPGAVTWTGSTIEVNYSQTVSQVYLQYLDGGGQAFSGGSPGQIESFQGTGSYSGDMIMNAWLRVGNDWIPYRFYTYSAIKTAFGLHSVPYPYPSGSWDDYIDYCRDSNGSTSLYDVQIYHAGHRRKFGMLTLVEFWVKHHKGFSQTPDLWKTRHYPFHAVKEGATLFCDFLADLEFGDYLGLVTYDETSRIEYGLNDAGMPYVDLNGDPLTSDYDAIDTIQAHKQAGHYGFLTNIGGGIDDAIQLLSGNGRNGARPTIIVMTDGNANRRDSSWSLPADWDWDQVTDFDGDGSADYSTSDVNKLYAIGKAKEAVDLGFTVHTMSVGANADRDLMAAIAFIGGGLWIDIPGGSTVSEMEEQVSSAFSQIAANVPPAKLIYDLP